MNTDKIHVLCRLSDEYNENAESLKCHNSDDAKALKIVFAGRTIELGFDEYPELKPLVGKIKDYVLKSETKRQNEIKLEIARCL